MYSLDMSQEREPKQLFKQGKTAVKIVAADMMLSKKQNKMFKIDLVELETEAKETVYLVAEQGKMWTLKTLLDAMKCKKDDSGKYCFSLEDLLNKIVIADVIHEDNVFTNANGQQVRNKQNRIKRFYGYEEVTREEIGEDDEVPF